MAVDALLSPTLPVHRSTFAQAPGVTPSRHLPNETATLPCRLSKSIFFAPLCFPAPEQDLERAPPLSPERSSRPCYVLCRSRLDCQQKGHLVGPPWCNSKTEPAFSPTPSSSLTLPGPPTNACLLPSSPRRFSYLSWSLPGQCQQGQEWCLPMLRSACRPFPQPMSDCEGSLPQGLCV